MFDSYYTQRTTEYVTKEVNVKEYRAPTDDSVKLLNEMTEKAKENLIKSFSTTNNTLQMSCTVYDDPRSFNREFLCKFTLNGKDHVIEVPIPLWEFDTMDKAVMGLYNKVCSKLTDEIMMPLLDEMLRK